MSPGAIIAVSAWGLFIVLMVLALCRAAAYGDEMADRARRDCAEDDHRALGLLIAMDDHRTPHSRRHFGGES